MNVELRGAFNQTDPERIDWSISAELDLKTEKIRERKKVLT